MQRTSIDDLPQLEQLENTNNFDDRRWYER